MYTERDKTVADFEQQIERVDNSNKCGITSLFFSNKCRMFQPNRTRVDNIDFKENKNTAMKMYR